MIVFIIFMYVDGFASKLHFSEAAFIADIDVDMVTLQYVSKSHTHRGIRNLLNIHLC